MCFKPFRLFTLSQLGHSQARFLVRGRCDTNLTVTDPLMYLQTQKYFASGLGKSTGEEY